MTPARLARVRALSAELARLLAEHDAEDACPACDGDGEVASGEIDSDGDELPPVLCRRCGGTGRAKSIGKSTDPVVTDIDRARARRGLRRMGRLPR